MWGFFLFVFSVQSNLWWRLVTGKKWMTLKWFYLGGKTSFWPFQRWSPLPQILRFVMQWPSVSGPSLRPQTTKTLSLLFRRSTLTWMKDQKVEPLYLSGQSSGELTSLAPFSSLSVTSRLTGCTASQQPSARSCGMASSSKAPQSRRCWCWWRE